MLSPGPGSFTSSGIVFVVERLNDALGGRTVIERFDEWASVLSHANTPTEELQLTVVTPILRSEGKSAGVFIESLPISVTEVARSLTVLRSVPTTRRRSALRFGFGFGGISPVSSGMDVKTRYTSGPWLS
jgi:hypothetical protein